MSCFEENACYNFFFCKENESSVKDERKLEITVIQSTLEEVKKTMSDSESDSGVGSVRTNDQSSENDSAGEQKKAVTLITPKTTNKTVNRGKSVKRSESVLSRFSFFFPTESEKLADLLVEEFKKNDQSNGLAMERMFRNNQTKPDKPEATGFNILSFLSVFHSVFKLGGN